MGYQGGEPPPSRNLAPLKYLQLLYNLLNGGPNLRGVRGGQAPP